MEVISALAVLLMLLSIFLGTVSIINPKWVRQKTRGRSARSFFGFAFAMLVISLVTAPKNPGQNQTIQNTPVGDTNSSIPEQETNAAQRPASIRAPVPVEPAIQVILDSQWYDSVEAAELETAPNPLGDGVFVWVEQALLHGRTKVLAWLVLDGVPYALNRDSKTLTKSPWPEDAQPGAWERTGLPASLRIIDASSVQVRARIAEGAFR